MSSKTPVFSGPSGRMPGRRIKFGSTIGNYQNPRDVLGEMDDSLMLSVPEPIGSVLDTSEFQHLAAPGRISAMMKADFVALRDGASVQSGYVRELMKRWGYDPDSLTSLSEGTRRKLHNRLVIHVRELEGKRHEAMGNLVRANAELRTELADVDSKIKLHDDLIAWLSRPLVMERPQGSSFHHLLEWCKTKSNGLDSDAASFMREKFQLFVIEHDWSAAFRGSTDFASGEISLPYDYTCFEMRISGVRVLLCVGADLSCVLALGLHGEWICTTHQMSASGALTVDDRMVNSDRGKTEVLGLLALISAQVRAVCIMLDAEVAEVELRRAPERLNHQRERQGRAPLRDHHVLRLAHRHRVRAADHRAADYDPDYTRKRLHFRRGHDRHYPNYKVWIKWQLVGDPDLGFVDKEYRL